MSPGGRATSSLDYRQWRTRHRGRVPSPDPVDRLDQPHSEFARSDRISIVTTGLDDPTVVPGQSHILATCPYPGGYEARKPAGQRGSCGWAVNGRWDLSGGGRSDCPVAARCSARSSVGRWHLPLSGGGLGEVDAVAGGYLLGTIASLRSTRPRGILTGPPAGDARGGAGR